MTLDETDRHLLRAVQEDAQLTAQELGERLNLSASQAGRRRQRLEQAGIIRGARAVIAPEGVGLVVQAFVQVQMATHDPAQVRAFTRTIDLSPEIVSAWTLTGEADFLLRVYCADLAALHRLVHEVILPIPAVARVQSQIVMDQQKPDAPLPT
ncbi:Lrp/AsnC family transcriptional regulator [Rhodobacteraceae bacterium W635]|uniref:Lrp/AsnC family transcriptional regulator n=1 Tax=Nioella halotolerans TaxID=2303578 RepID=UPI000E3DFF2A|nr:Lrp/AsnC family transcriptional regulator [Rhodobacteraceae bacterium W635]